MSRRAIAGSLTRAPQLIRPITIQPPPFPPARFSSSSSSLSPSSQSVSTASAMDPPNSSSSASPRFSAGTDEASARAAVASLLARPSPSPSSPGGEGRWALVKDGEALERSFKFKTFAKTWDFMTAVSLQCKLKNHHPEWSNVYNTTYIRWTTHNPKGLSSKDVDLAAVCDALAKDFGELPPEPVSCAVRDVADRVVGEAGPDCCTPKK
ncbi:4a-hydroxytetrahydrobiopterin dehydratase [Purpureocillium takamizusanense]|uniref:4a-hydroxytetrahydrobiopterin dehydratase n=1 Tax=Purpureocillium takamizusanense TaxID=2060973 RepID=A0A9Q8QLB1_9HYPO|nr:4a-hydroxytetrahydrobiopterin dehydratase [Purpureocillium takamizusanense]UNI21833.1 4a-hydroxytetrahydrobiopterin dehydratase [Purpureocillium takamizusanense]